eukprot:CAMPEP_0119329964 /NCGR_PEP_ID=MMETSP1333-20130426/77173_1 /TAXON_ID=418940 /ORGANISM="Scyphosphaera apsteinii, Strain RCC1455" /LENGTH=58 /DNA_ID=CAMNT_0007339225 /DNA_START=553 /DNA_END=729 /DNA_ORIENTATION=+
MEHSGLGEFGERVLQSVGAESWCGAARSAAGIVEHDEQTDVQARPVCAAVDKVCVTER